MRNVNEERNRAALEVLRSTGLYVLEAALVAREAMTAGNGSVRRVRKCLELGTEQLRLREKTVSFAKAVEQALDARIRKGLRPRSIVDFRYVCRRLITRNPWLAGRRVRCMTPDDCARCLTTAFATPPQFKKARAILSGGGLCHPQGLVRFKSCCES